jgi:hypothetical protein
MNFSESEIIFYRGRAKFMKGTGDEVGDLTVRGCLCLCMCALYDHLTRTTPPLPTLATSQVTSTRVFWLVGSAVKFECALAAIDKVCVSMCS